MKWRNVARGAFRDGLDWVATSTGRGDVSRIIEPAAALRWQFDLGDSDPSPGFRTVRSTTAYGPACGYGWVPGHRVQAGAIEAPDALRGSYLWSGEEAIFRIDLPAGRYRVSLLLGDARVGRHGLKLSIRNGTDHPFPAVQPDLPGRQMTLMVDVALRKKTTDFLFTPSLEMWVVNAIKIEAVEQLEPPRVAEEQIWIAAWPDFNSWPNPVSAHRRKFERLRRKKRRPLPTGLDEIDYLTTIARGAEYFARFQTSGGAIIDPYENEEMQYATPAFALAAATAAVHGKHGKLLEPAALAMDHATESLETAARDCHEDFYPPMVARTFRLLAQRVSAERAGEWRRRIRAYDPHRTYRFGQGGGNWNVVALSGEAIYEIFGIKEGLGYAEEALERQASRFTHWGMYLDVNSEALAYDHFPRLWLADMLGSGYKGRLAAGLRNFLERGAWTSLFLQSPTGELPAGGRSSHHQWNEAAQCVTFEMFSKLAEEERDVTTAGVFKRAARMSLASLTNWVRPEGDLWIVKNRVSPEKRHGYDPYSFHSQYNLLPLAILSIAYEYALSTGKIEEQATPSEVGGFVIDIRRDFHKIVANAGGTYVEIDTGGLPEHDPTGLIRIHFSGGCGQIGPSGGIVSAVAGATAAIGVGWKDADEKWRRLAEFQKGAIERADLEVLSETPEEVSFRVTYRGDLKGVEAVVESYRIVEGRVSVSWEVSAACRPLRVVWPVLVSDGAKEAANKIDGTVLQVDLEGKAQRFSTPGARSLFLEETVYPCRNGWVKLAVAEYDPGVIPCLEVELLK